MCFCSRTVDPALDSPAIEGKYNQRMLWSECAVVQTHLSIRLLHMFCYIQRLQEVHLISEGSDQTTDVQAQSVQADLTLRTNFIVGFAIHTLTCVLFVQTLTQHSE